MYLLWDRSYVLSLPTVLDWVDDVLSGTGTAGEVPMFTSNYGVLVPSNINSTTGTVQITQDKHLIIHSGTGTLTVSGNVSSTPAVTVTAGYVNVTSGDIVATAGLITASTGFSTTSGGFTADTGDIVATTGHITASTGFKPQVVDSLPMLEILLR